uniref:Uncharacterized protein LOC108041693 isoform X2 n=1 Tax=Drosophila rhopaloa TaxID=1041015 RepID=A0A6P4EAN4_DRORH
MTHILEDPSYRNYYFKDSIAYTEDHIPVQKVHIYNVLPKLNKKMLEHYFGIYGRVLRLEVFKPKSGERWRRLTGFVLFAKKRCAAKALNRRIHRLHGTSFNVMASDSWHQPEAYGMSRDPPEILPNTEHPSPPAIMILNDHCLEHVFQYLTLPDQVHFARSCLRFRGIYQMATTRLHKSVNLSQFNNMTVWDMRDFFELSGSHVEKLMGVLPMINSERLTNFLALRCTNLMTMKLFKCHNILPNMHKIFSKMHKLETLELQNSNIEDDSLLTLRNLRSLKTLNLDGNQLIGSTLAKLPVTIESLSLNDCGLCGGYLTAIGKVLHQLKKLSIIDIVDGSVDFQTIIQDKSFALLETLRITVDEDEKYELVAQLPSLKNLTIYTSFEDGLRIELLEQLVKHKSKQLEKLEIFGPIQLTKEMLIHISKLEGLHTLIVSHVKSDNDLVLLSSLVNLEQFTLRQSGNVSDFAVLKLFRSCRKLDYLYLENCEILTHRLVLDIVGQVRKEMDNKKMHRKLPIQLGTLQLDYDEKTLIQEHPVRVPKDIITILYDESAKFDLSPNYSVSFGDDDSYHVDSQSDDDLDFDFGYGYVHPSWPYDSDGDFVGLGLFGDDSD